MYDGRLWWSQALLYDEAYDILQELNLLDPPTKKAEGSSGPTYPSEHGWEHTLPDGVVTRLRFQGDTLQWCLADRDFEMPSEYSIETGQASLF